MLLQGRITQTYLNEPSKIGHKSLRRKENPASQPCENATKLENNTKRQRGLIECQFL